MCKDIFVIPKCAAVNAIPGNNTRKGIRPVEYDRSIAFWSKFAGA